MKCLYCDTPLAADEAAFCGNDCEHDYMVTMSDALLDGKTGKALKIAQRRIERLDEYEAAQEMPNPDPVTQTGDDTYTGFAVTVPGVAQVEVVADVDDDGNPDPAADVRARALATRIHELFGE